MATPYWGALPKGPSTARHASGDDQVLDDQPPLNHMDPFSSSSAPQQQPRRDRASVQTARTGYTEAPTESTLSPFVSPTRSSFAPQGLAPRPPTLPYGSSEYADEFAEKRQRRRSLKNEEQIDRTVGPTPPAAPDVPRGPRASQRQNVPPVDIDDMEPEAYYKADGQQNYPRTEPPPVSYRRPYTQSVQPAGPLAPQRQNVPPVDIDDMEPEAYYKADGQQNYPRTERSQGASRPAGPPRDARHGRRKSSATNTVPLNGAGEALDSANQPTRIPTGRKVSTDIRSPLQHLETVLSKEEKRARMEAAEQRVRAKANADPKLLQPIAQRTQPRQPRPQPQQALTPRLVVLHR
ncbi:hypothetical protein HYQ46_009136 [Verticillium longisporum]|nr:hypothetical protein HYQ46_009136 [Verticillium longisporum]